MHKRRIDTPPGRLLAYPAVAVTLATLLLALPLVRYHPGLPEGNDVRFAVQSTLGFAEALREGVMMPRWVEAANQGLGAPTFVFYSPLVYYIGGLASLAMGSVVAGLRVVVIGLGLLSGLAMFLALRRTAPPLPVAVASALYVLAPYHVIDLYWRFALAEYAAFCWLPLLLLSTRRAVLGRGAEGLAGLAVAYSGLILTHLVTAFLAPLALIPYVLLLCARAGRWRRVPALLAAGVLALALAGFYLLPMLAQRGAVQLDYLETVSHGDVRRNFLLRDEVALGYRRAGIKPVVTAAGATQAGLAAAALGVLLVRRRKGTLRRTDGAEANDALALGLVVVWTTVLQLPVSERLWTVVPGLSTVQFPWRLQSFQLLAACALVAPALRALAPRPAGHQGGFGWAALLVAALGMLITGIVAVRARPASFGPEDVLVAAGEVIFEYAPRGVVHWSRWDAELEQVSLAGPGEVSVELWEAHRRRLAVTTSQPNRLRVRTFAYPSWTARIDGRPVAITPSPSMGMIEVALPAGRHTVRLAFDANPHQRVGTAASAAGLVALAIVAWKRRAEANASRREHSAG